MVRELETGPSGITGAWHGENRVALKYPIVNTNRTLRKPSLSDSTVLGCTTHRIRVLHPIYRPALEITVGSRFHDGSFKIHWCCLMRWTFVIGSPQGNIDGIARSEEHTSELQSLAYLVCRLL